MPNIRLVLAGSVWLLFACLIQTDLSANQSDSTDQILQEIRKYQKQFQAPVGAVVPPPEYRPENKRLKREIQQRVNCYLAALRNLEYLIRMRMIDRDQAVEISRELGTHDLLYAIPYWLIPMQNGWWRVGQEELVLADEAYHRFLMGVYSNVRTLRKSNTSDPLFTEAWAGVIIASALLRVDRPYLKREDLNYLKRVLTEIVPDNVGTDLQLEQFFSYNPPDDRPRYPDEITYAEWMQFLQTLSDSNQKVANIYARYGLLRLRWKQLHDSPKQNSLHLLLNDANALLLDFAKLPPVQGLVPRTDEWTYDRIQNLRDYIDEELHKLNDPRP
jgi:hypothetical protein